MIHSFFLRTLVGTLQYLVLIQYWSCTGMHTTRFFFFANPAQQKADKRIIDTQNASQEHDDQQRFDMGIAPPPACSMQPNKTKRGACRRARCRERSHILFWNGEVISDDNLDRQKKGPYKMKISLLVAATVTTIYRASLAQALVSSVQLGPRPYWLVNEMREGQLKDELSKSK